MAYFIKTGFWEKARKGYKEWLNLDELIQSLAPPAPEPAYKVYTALLTQNGGDNELFIEDFLTVGTQNIIKGVSYYIDVNTDNVDFSSIGAPSNAEGTNFIATADKLNSDFPDVTWSLRYNTGAPVVTVLENTIGNIWFEYRNTGEYRIYSDSQFIQNKTFAITAFPGNTNSGGSAAIYVNQVPQYLSMETRDYSGSLSDDILYDTSIEIRVYN